LGIERGRAFTESEVAHSSQVMMMGQDILEALFPHSSAVGKTVHLGGVPFLVVGEIARRGKMFGQSQDNIVMIPYNTLPKFFAGRMGPQRRGEFSMKAKPVDDDKMELAMDQITEVLRRRRHLRAHQPDNFVIETDDALLNLYH